MRLYRTRDATGLGALACAEGDDGLHWRKPPLDVAPWNG